MKLDKQFHFLWYLGVVERGEPPAGGAGKEWGEHDNSSGSMVASLSMSETKPSRQTVVTTNAAVVAPKYTI